MGTGPNRNSRKYERKSAPGVGLLEVSCERSGRKQKIATSILLDISRGGVGIQLDRRVYSGEILHLSNRFVNYTARVCHCTPTKCGYKVGLEFPSVDEAIFGKPKRQGSHV
jgi:hypothetical protein